MIIPGLSSPHIPYSDMKGSTCLHVFAKYAREEGTVMGIRAYVKCMGTKLGNIYMPQLYLNSISMFGHNKEKKESPKKSLKREIKAKKLELKKQKLEIRKQKAIARHKDKPQEAKSIAKPKKVKAVSHLAIAGSRIVGSAVGFLGAAAYESYRVTGLTSHMTLIYAGATVGASLLAAAPYAKSIARTNKTLLDVDEKMTAVDEVIGSQKEMIASAIAQIENAARSNPAVGSADLADLKGSLAELHRKLDSQSKPASTASEIHVAPPKDKGSNNVIAR